MNKVYFIILCLFVFMLPGEQRKKPLPMSELTNQNGPSYVPIPFPSTDEDIIFDLKYAVEKLFFRSQNHSMNCKTCSKTHEYEILAKFIRNDPEISISNIIKVKNFFHRYAHDYSFLIELSDLGGNPVMRIVIDSFGLWRSLAYPSGKNKLNPLENSLNSRNLKIMKKKGMITEQDIEKSEAVMFPNHSFCSEIFPAFLITSLDRRLFIVNYFENVYEIENDFKLSENEVKSQSYYPMLRRKSNIGNDFCLHDSVNDKILFLKRIELQEYSNNGGSDK